MDRRTEVTKFIRKDQRGIEVGPWFAPLAPKRDGYNCLSLDVFDVEQLRKTAEADPHIPKNLIPQIEDVDLLGTSTEIVEILERRNELGSFDYIISSHNFEHLPNPIKFLQGCSKALKSDGILSMAIPDKRVCFDYFRPHSTTSQMIEAYFENRNKPTYAQVFDLNALHSRYRRVEEMQTGFSMADDSSNVVALRTLREAFLDWEARRRAGDQTYIDTHCWMFTPASFELLVNDLNFLGLIDFRAVEISATNGNEFYAHLRNGGAGALDDELFYNRRQVLLQRIADDLAENPPSRAKLKLMAQPSSEYLASIVSTLNGEISELQKTTKLLLGSLTDVGYDARVAELEASIHALMHSRSWRFTAPLRGLADGVRKLVRR